MLFQSQGRRITILELMALIAGLAVGLWLIASDIDAPPRMGDLEDDWLKAVVVILGGLSLVGPPLLLLERCRRRGGAWGPGKFLWFAQGMASWLLWPPIVYRRLDGGKFGDSSAAICFAYGTPLMAIYVTAALLAGGWLRKKRRRRFAQRSWRERFGLVLGLAWACTGLYILCLLYSEDFR